MDSALDDPHISILIPTEYEKSNNETENDTENKELEETVNFILNEKYLETIIEKLYTENTSETDSIFVNDDLISKVDLEDIIIEQKESKNLTQCVIVDKIDGYIKRCENSNIMIINEKPEPLHELDENIQLFEMSQVINNNICKFNKIFEDLLEFQHNKKGELEYNKDFDLTTVDSKILKQINFSCKLPPPNDDNEIL
ncbi:hypothetical protein Glove_85g18 [Diversispora epigaea]|uniref:Uncharacterized protein n=1 Tax=Diversispora epigaea TaxID=1348612 RepID=A0A397J9K2_9GLOM|nr:hypothetical protein Glove_85g18 [Diversispora epigaea]